MIIDSDCNFIPLLKLSGQGDAKMDEWLKKNTDKYTSHELLKIMAQHMLRSIAGQIQFVTVMIDEATYMCMCSNQEQVTVVFHTVDYKNLSVSEEVIGLSGFNPADVLIAVIKNVTLRLNLAIRKLCC